MRSKLGLARLTIVVGLVATLALASYVTAQPAPLAGSITSYVLGNPSTERDPAKQFPLPQGVTGQTGPTDSASRPGYARITDDEETIVAQVPAAWKDVDTGRWVYQGQDVGVFLAASTDLDNFSSRRSAPGVFIGVSRALAQAYDEEQLLALEAATFSRQCKRQGRSTFQDPFYTGLYDTYVTCGNNGQELFVAATMSANREQLILLRIGVVNKADQEAAARIFETFQVLGDPDVDFHND